MYDFGLSVQGEYVNGVFHSGLISGSDLPCVSQMLLVHIASLSEAVQDGRLLLDYSNVIGWYI